MMRNRIGSLGLAGGLAFLGLMLGRTLLFAGPWNQSEPAHLSAAPCAVSGYIISNTTWSPAGCDPYIVSGNVVVQTGVTLTVLPGTTVKFDSQLALTVQGTFVARGTSTNPITFTSNLTSPAPGDWGYIYFASSSTDAVFNGFGNYLEGCIVQYAVVKYAGGTGITRNAALRIDGASPFIDHNVIEDNLGYGLWAWNGAGPLVTYNLFQRNGGGLSIGNGPVVMHNQILNNIVNGDGGGIYIAGTALVRDNSIAGNSASEDGGGLYVRGPGSVTENLIIDNIATGNGGGVFVRNGSKPPINQNDIYGNLATLGNALYNDNSPTGPPLNAENNYWGTTNPAEIEAAIYHFVDNAAVGLVDYDPFANGPINPTPTPTPSPPPTPAPVLMPLVFRNYINYFEGPWEVEDNDAYTQANGALQSGKSYFGYANDAKDYFSVYLFNFGQLVIDRPPDSGAGGGVQILLFYESTDNFLIADQEPPYHIEYTGPAGWYYIYLYTAYDYNSTTSYTITVTYP